MRETAVEWLVEQLFELRNPTLNQIEIMKQAKEMEKQQQGYSEEEVFILLAKMADTIFRVPERFTNSREWFNKFKK